MSIKDQFPKQYKQVLELVRLWIKGENIINPQETDPRIVIAAAEDMYREVNNPECTVDMVVQRANIMQKILAQLENGNNTQDMLLAAHIYFSVDGVIVYTAATRADENKWLQDISMLQDRDLVVAHYGLQVLSEVLIETEVIGSTINQEAT